MATTQKETESKFRARMAKLKVPEGFTTKFTVEQQPWTKQPLVIFVMENHDDVRFEMHLGGGGHTHFKMGETWGTFDRVGVSDSFYHMEWSGKPISPEKLDTIIAEQFEKIEKAREYRKTAIKLPGIPFSVSPEGLKQLRATMAKPNGSRSFMPSGFGTGYHLLRKPRHGWGTKRAQPELEKLLAVSPLYVETFDAD